MIKSQDELPQSGRDNTTLIATIDELERVKKQLEIALGSMRDSRELFYKLGQIETAVAIGNQLHMIKDLQEC